MEECTKEDILRGKLDEDYEWKLMYATSDLAHPLHSVLRCSPHLSTENLLAVMGEAYVAWLNPQVSLIALAVGELALRRRLVSAITQEMFGEPEASRAPTWEEAVAIRRLVQLPRGLLLPNNYRARKKWAGKGANLIGAPAWRRATSSPPSLLRREDECSYSPGAGIRTRGGLHVRVAQKTVETNRCGAG